MGGAPALYRGGAIRPGTGGGVGALRAGTGGGLVALHAMRTGTLHGDELWREAELRRPLPVAKAMRVESSRDIVRYGPAAVYVYWLPGRPVLGPVLKIFVALTAIG